MAYFVTGATGFIGSYLVAKLVKRGAPVYAPSPDGQRFLVNQILDDVPTPPITVILNWQKR